MGSATRIKFGTDGWRGVIADDFTFDNVRTAAAAIASYVLAKEDPAKGVCIGYDTRFGSPAFAAAVAEVIASAGIPVDLATGITPTPALSFGVKERGAAGGIMITSSHNPAQWNGVKYKAWYGGSGKPSIMADIESRLEQSLPVAAPATIRKVDFLPAYIEAIKRFVDLDLIAKSGYKFGIDCMYGAGRGILAGIFREIGVDFIEIRANHDPLFPGINPEPIEPHIRAMQETVISEKCQAGLITDGDADRIGAVDENGNFVDPHKIYSVLLQWLLERKKWPGDVTRAFNTTCMLDRICARYGRTLHEHGIGFKYVCDLMLDKDILIGGEESGGIGISRHLPERDGLLNSLLLANVMAEEKKTLGELVEWLQKEYGEHQYGRIDLHIPDALKNAAIARARAGVKEFAGMPVVKVETLDGIKFFLDNPEAKSKPNAARTWLLLRASGTEPLMRIYSESCSKESVKRLLDAAREFAMSSLN
ncbi:phosphoglucomutase/phosphomannomutase family protein [Paracidobacterium acidisoli]|uniref:Phosphoglucomutase/phosphomannomutase family protein n=1 Tax=Paracidobacterium acidisoli TaxID=2303751 RepID=A0A372IIR8_9BACT|nr:phosphoglucomutase/phosphomannomutase family protein [Paracidobacterium acidisoli]MBT9333292.1 phosphoglucomutase/phosphomannomutase family protein [Paracidobacterium acidisoli]